MAVRSASGADESAEIEPSEGPVEVREPARGLQSGSLVCSRYELQQEVGVGGLGTVWAARHLGFNELVALKFLRPELADHADAANRFSREARAGFVLRSEHVVRVLDTDSHEGLPFFAMELLQGSDLRRLIERSAPLPAAVAVDYALQVCEALSAAHASGIVHRDIKPENLFLVSQGIEDARIKVLDFGISQVPMPCADTAQDAGTSSLTVGTPAYMSPEQVQASQELDARSDVWSLGCVLYELLTAQAPFECETPLQSCAAVLAIDPPAARVLRPELDERLSAVIARCLRKEATQRFSNTAELALALAPFGTGHFDSYPARCRALLAGGRRPPRERSVKRDLAGTSVTSQDARSVVGAVLPRVAIALRPRRVAWLAVFATASALSLLYWASAARTQQQLHVVTPGKAVRQLQARGLHSDGVDTSGGPLRPRAAPALEQGKAEPQSLQHAAVHGTKRRHRAWRRRRSHH